MTYIIIAIMDELHKLLQLYTNFVFDDDTNKLYATRNEKVYDIVKTSKYNPQVIEKCVCDIDKLMDFAKSYHICYIDDVMVYDIIAGEFIC